MVRQATPDAPVAAASPGGRRPSLARLFAAQVGYSVKSTLRNPLSAFFTLVFPLMFLLLFNALLSGSPTASGLPFAQVYSPGIAVFAMVAACFTTLAINVTTLRDLGILKRVRGTPLPGWLWMAGRVVAAVTVAFLSVTLMIIVAILVFDVEIVWHTLPAAILTVAIGGLTFCALGMAATAIIANAEAAPAVLNLLVFPLLFVSGVFFPLNSAPEWLTTFAKFFPIQHLAAALQADFDPATAAPGVMWSDLAVVAAWGVAGVILAVRFFRWENQPGARRRVR